jgi:hypothetical protein
MRLSYERYFLIFGILIAVGLFVSFEVAAILGVRHSARSNSAKS